MRKWLIGIAIVLIAIFLYSLFTPSNDESTDIFWAKIANVREIATPPADLLAAKARWLSNPIKHYRLSVQYSRSIYPVVDCSQSEEVINEQAVKILKDDCGENLYLQHFAPLPQTVTELFAQFDKESTTINFQEPGYPGCPYFMGVNVTYSSENYPASAKYSWLEASPWNLGPTTYETIYGETTPIQTCLVSNADTRKPDMTIMVRPLP